MPPSSSSETLPAAPGTVDLPPESNVDVSLVVVASNVRVDPGLFEEMVAGFQAEFAKENVTAEIIVVDDGIGGAFFERVKSLRNRWPRFQIIRLLRSFGESTALTLACDRARGRFVITNTWYLQVDPTQVHEVLGKLRSGYDYVAARRVGRVDSPVARVQSWLFNAFTRGLTGSRLHDLNCSFRGFRREVLAEIPLHGDMFRFLPVLARQTGFRVVEVPVRHLAEKGPSTFLNVGLYVRRFLDVLTLFFLIKFTKKPLRFFGLMGTVFFAAGSIISVWMFLEKVVGGRGLADRPQIILGVFLLVLGVIVVSIGLIGEIIIFLHGRQLRDYHIDTLLSDGTVPAEAADPGRIRADATTVEDLRRGGETDWSAYVEACPDASLFHGLAWRDVLVSVFRHEPCYIVARRDGRVVGVLPLFAVRSLLFGRCLLSVPFGVYGGILADDEDACRALVDAAAERAAADRSRYVELRHRTRVVPGLPETDLYQAFAGAVPDSREACLARIPRKARAEVRRAAAAGLVAEFDVRDVSELHRLFSLNKRRHGSPIFPASLFWRIREIYGDRCVFLRVRKDGRTLSAVLSFIHGDTMMPYYSGATPEAPAHSADNFMYHALMERAFELGLRRFDFGRSREGTGPWIFKRHQGFTPEPLCYQYILNTATAIPQLNPSNPKYDVVRAVFRRLPLPVAQKIGSFVSKRMPH